MVRRVSQKMYYVIQVVSLSGNIMHYGFALLVVVQGCSGGGISPRVTLRNSVIFQSCITDLVAWFYVDGFLRWLVFFVYLRVQSQVGFWSTNCTGMKLWVDADMHLPVVRMDVYTMHVLACS